MNERRLFESTVTVNPALSFVRSSIEKAQAQAVKIIPVLVVVFAVVVGAISYLPALRMVAVVVVVVLLAIVVYGSAQSYGESALALVAGLLTAFIVEWDQPRFILFMAACGTFSFWALFWTWLRVSLEVQTLQEEAAASLAGKHRDAETIEKVLKHFAEWDSGFSLGRRRRAEVLGVLCFRKIPLRLIGAGLKSCGRLAVITRVHHEEVASFVADVYRMFRVHGPALGEHLLTRTYDEMREAPVAPKAFIRSFRSGARAALEHELTGARFVSHLGEGLRKGVADDDMYRYISERAQVCDWEDPKAKTSDRTPKKALDSGFLERHSEVQGKVRYITTLRPPNVEFGDDRR